ncbi:Hint domain-containing protein [Celeribacter persicus]|jgi:hypothetical protein|uniref:Hint domain-containing protein n=1 Tax=Celeribacter persicus TaxID=1651082 RepID=A0A2T5HVR7_9RHOB|nr:Hint domain-containing protein [Celeribacter persicus]PTQ75689.1 Hint domain-containing protein [Celeribacter persicus]
MSQPLPGPLTGSRSRAERPQFSHTRSLGHLPASDPPTTGVTQPVKTAWTVRRTRPVERPVEALRRYNIAWRAPNGDICETPQTAPALPVFEAAFNAFARGALIPTVAGPVAIEDLLPGDEVVTVDNGVQQVEWIGSMALDTRGIRSPEAHAERLYRITSDTFGLGRPTPDLMLGSGARYLLKTDGLKSWLGTAQAMAPITGMVDGVSVIEVTPISAVRSYHLALGRHSLIRVNGVELESYHPGTAASAQLQGDLRARFMALFPHLDSLGDFGALAYPRLTPGDLSEMMFR